MQPRPGDVETLGYGSGCLYVFPTLASLLIPKWFPLLKCYTRPQSRRRTQQPQTASPGTRDHSPRTRSKAAILAISETIPQHANEPEKGNASERHQVDRNSYRTRTF
jgi:hypothetical protein